MLILNPSSPETLEAGKESADRPSPNPSPRVPPCIRRPSVWSAGAHMWIPAPACHGWWELMAWAVCQGERQGRGSPCRWLSKGQVGEAPPCLGVPGATGHFWYIYLWRCDMCFGNLKGLAIQSCPTLCDPMDCNLPGSCVHGIFQARILEWVAIPFSRGSSRPRDRTQVSCIACRFFTRKP